MVKSPVPASYCSTREVRCSSGGANPELAPWHGRQQDGALGSSWLEEQELQARVAEHLQAEGGHNSDSSFPSATFMPTFRMRVLT